MLNLDRNQLIEAGAGTGKTYTLVQAILQTLLQKRVPLTQIVALTFTKKAAGEMKERVADELRRISLATVIPEAYRTWGYRLEDLQAVAKGALEQVDRANISTIHSFAFSLLKRFPLLAGINPNSEVDEKGLRYAEVFDAEWPKFLARELAEGAPHAAEWLEILRRLPLAEVEELARTLSDFEIPLGLLPVSDEGLEARLDPLHQRLLALKASHPTGDKNGRLLSACEEVLGTVKAGLSLSANADALQALSLEPGKTKAWSADELRELKQAQKIARNVAAGGDRVIALATARLKPFISHSRAVALSKGYLSNSALLALACSLVRRHHDIRGILQREYRALFIDEFQDTDPLQGELILFLAEKPGGHAKTWREVELEAGKLFVVGDPKQSIYRFRGADIAAYRQIADLMIGQGGVATPLQRSWRSHDQIIHAVNHAFSQIIRENGHISPPYVALEPLRQRDEQLPLQQVELVLARPDQPITSDAAQAQEAQDVASWISDHVGRLHVVDKKDGRRRLLHRDIALVFRSTPSMRAFVEALRDQDIPFVVEGERYFYSTPEVTDLVNLLRVAENPHDRLALVGFLRSPLAGFTDPEILALKEAKALDAARPLPSDFSPAHQAVWTLLQHLQERVGRVPLKALLRFLFDESFILELAARSYHHDQTVANVLKLKRLLESFAEEGVTSLRALLAKVRTFMENDRLEGESPLADEAYDAVRLLTIHKAKGLEFPVVILPSLHSGRRAGQSDSVVFDWSSNRIGVRAGGLQNLEKFFLDAEAQEREREEEKRVLYVAMTRGRERLVLSGGVRLMRTNGDSYLEWLRQAWNLDWNSIGEGPCALGPTEIHVRFTQPPAARKAKLAEAGASSLVENLDHAAFAEAWNARRERTAAAYARPLIVTPSALAKESLKAEERVSGLDADAEKRTLSEDAALLGTLLHRTLERWDYRGTAEQLLAEFDRIAAATFASFGRGFEPQAPLLERGRRLLRTFASSSDYHELARATILGREVPFFYKERDGRLVRGSMDVLYRSPEGRLIVGDYKSSASAQAMSRYQAQGDAYRSGVHAALGEEPEFKVIALSASRDATAGR